MSRLSVDFSYFSEKITQINVSVELSYLGWGVWIQRCKTNWTYLFWPRFYIVVLGIAFFFLTLHSLFTIFIWTFISPFFLEFYFPFLFGLLFQFFFNFLSFFFNSLFIRSRSHFGFLPFFYFFIFRLWRQWVVLKDSSKKVI